MSLRKTPFKLCIFKILIFFVHIKVHRKHLHVKYNHKFCDLKGRVLQTLVLLVYKKS